MVEVNIEQGTPHWLRVRRGGPLDANAPIDPAQHFLRVGGSEIAGICGLLPERFEKSRPCDKFTQVLRERQAYLRRDEPPEWTVTAPMHHGTIAENSTLVVYGNKLREHPALGVPCVTAFDAATLRVDDGHYFYGERLPAIHGCSPDGQVVCQLRHGGAYTRLRLVEAKSPWGNLYPAVPPYYVPQVQYQMWVTGVRECDFVAVKFPRVVGDTPPAVPGNEPFFITRFTIDVPYCEWLRDRVEDFCQQLRRAGSNDAHAQYVPPTHLPEAPPSQPMGREILAHRPI